MSKETISFEFSKKSKSKRQNIFRNRVRKTIRSLASSFYQKRGVPVQPATVDTVTDLIVNDIICTISEMPEFASKILDPEVTDREALLEKLYRDVLKTANGEKPFEFIAKGGLTSPNEGNKVCGKKRKKQATA